MGEKDNILYWGAPTIRLGDQIIGPPKTDVPCPLFTDEQLDELGNNTSHWIDTEPYSLEFEVRSIQPPVRKQLKRRMPRKFKKQVKKMFAKQVGLKPSKIKFVLNFLNNQKGKPWRKTK